MSVCPTSTWLRLLYAITVRDPMRWSADKYHFLTWAIHRIDSITALRGVERELIGKDYHVSFRSIEMVQVTREIREHTWATVVIWNSSHIICLFKLDRLRITHCLEESFLETLKRRACWQINALISMAPFTRAFHTYSYEGSGFWKISFRGRGGWDHFYPSPENNTVPPRGGLPLHVML